MKALLTAVLLASASASIAVFPIHASAAGHDAHARHAGQATMQSAPAGKLVDGVVKKIDKAAGKVTLSHGPLTNLNMPAMTMVFRVKEAAWLDQMKDGDKIRFIADTVNGSIAVVHFEPGK